MQILRSKQGKRQLFDVTSNIETLGLAIPGKDALNYENRALSASLAASF